MEKIYTKIENLFLLFCLITGFMFILLIPIFEIPDEEAHFEKIYSISEGIYSFEKCTLKDGNTYACNKLPISILELRKDYKDNSFLFIQKKNIKPLEKDKTDYLIYMMPTYSILSYLPEVLTLKILKLIDLPPFFMVLILRIISLLTYCLITYFAIKIIPIKKHLLALCALVPTAVYLSGGISSDGIIISLCFLYIAYVFKLAYDSNTKIISGKNIVILTLLILYISACKFPYAFLSLLLFIIPKAKFNKSKIKFILSEIGVISLYIVFYLIHYFMINKGITSSVPIFDSPIKTLTYTIQNPSIFLNKLLKTVLLYFPDIVTDSIAKFGDMKSYIPFFAVLPYLIALALLGYYKANNETPCDIEKTNNKILFLLIVILFFITIFSINYLLFSNEVYKSIIIVQGRYFTPLLPLVYSIFASNKYIKYDNIFKLTVPVYIFLVFICIIELINYYYL